MVIEYFGVLNTVFEGVLKIDVAEAISVDELLNVLSDEYPRFIEFRHKTAVACGDTIVDRGEVINTHKTIALIPPVAGG